MIDAGLIDIGNTLNLNLLAKVSVTFLKREGSVFLGAAKEVGDGHQQPKATDADDGANLAFVESEFPLNPTEKDLDAPSERVEIENLPYGQRSVRGKKDPQSRKVAKGVFRKAKRDGARAQTVQANRSEVRVILSSANGHKVGGLRIFRAKRRGELADALFDVIRINHAVGLERADGLKAFGGEGVRQLFTGMPAIAEKITLSGRKRQFFRNFTRNCDFGTGFVVQDGSVGERQAVAGQQRFHDLMSVILFSFQMRVVEIRRFYWTRSL